VSERHYHDPELAGGGDVDVGGGGGGGGESVRRLDFQARRATGGRRERGVCSTGSEIRFVSEPLLNEP